MYIYIHTKIKKKGFWECWNLGQQLCQKHSTMWMKFSTFELFSPNKKFSMEKYVLHGSIYLFVVKKTCRAVRIRMFDKAFISKSSWIFTEAWLEWIRIHGLTVIYLKKYGYNERYIFFTNIWIEILSCWKDTL